VPIIPEAGVKTMNMIDALEPCPDCGSSHHKSCPTAKTRQNRIAKLTADRDALLQALKGLLADIEEYQTINHLGGENNHSQVQARAAIKQAEQK